MPTRNTPWHNGTPCWIDYSVPDVEGAKALYGTVLGWTYEGGDPEYGGYLTALAGGRKAAGLAPQMDPNDPPRWRTYFATDDAAGTARRITEAGGTVLVEPMQVGPMGTMVIALDPQGNPFGLWQAGGHTGVQIYNEPGGLVWNEAAVDDPEAGRRFYSAVFGFRFDEVEGAGGYATFATDGGSLGGLGALQPGAPKGWATCFAVASTDEAVAGVEAAGGKVVMAAQDMPFGRFAVVEDPWGAAFSVLQELDG